MVLPIGKAYSLDRHLPGNFRNLPSNDGGQGRRVRRAAYLEVDRPGVVQILRIRFEYDIVRRFPKCFILHGLYHADDFGRWTLIHPNLVANGTSARKELACQRLAHDGYRWGALVIALREVATGQKGRFERLEKARTNHIEVNIATC